jgi:hypothetical protein
MGQIIGGNDGMSTWAKLRSPIANWSLPGSPVDEYFHSRHYLQGFRTSGGNGLLATTVQMPGFNLSSEGFFFSPGITSTGLWTVEQSTQLIGQLVTSAGSFPFYISSTVFEDPWEQVTAEGEPPILTISSLTAF